MDNNQYQNSMMNQSPHDQEISLNINNQDRDQSIRGGMQEVEPNQNHGSKSQSAMTQYNKRQITNPNLENQNDKQKQKLNTEGQEYQGMQQRSLLQARDESDNSVKNEGQAAAQMHKADKLSTERPRTKVNEQLAVLDAGDSQIKVNQYQNEMSNRSNVKNKEISSSVDSIKNKDEQEQIFKHLQAKLEYERKSSSFKLAQNEAARTIWEQSNYTSGFTNHKEQWNALGSQIGNRQSINLSASNLNHPEQSHPHNGSTQPMRNHIMLGNSHEPSNSSKENQLISPKFYQMQNPIEDNIITELQNIREISNEFQRTQNDQDRQHLTEELNNYIDQLNSDKQLQKRGQNNIDLTLYENKDSSEQQWTFDMMTPRADNSVMQNEIQASLINYAQPFYENQNNTTEYLNLSSNQSGQLGGITEIIKTQSDANNFSQQLNHQVGLESQKQSLNLQNLQKLQDFDSRIQKMEDQFKSKFEQKVQAIDDPRQKISEFMVKKQYLWLNKSLKKIEEDFKYNRSLFGLKLLDNLNNKKLMLQSNDYGKHLVSNQGKAAGKSTKNIGSRSQSLIGLKSKLAKKNGNQFRSIGKSHGKKGLNLGIIAEDKKSSLEKQNILDISGSSNQNLNHRSTKNTIAAPYLQEIATSEQRKIPRRHGKQNNSLLLGMPSAGKIGQQNSTDKLQNLNHKVNEQSQQQVNQFAEMHDEYKQESVIPIIQEQVNRSYVKLQLPTKLPDINRKIQQNYTGTEAQPSDNEDSIFLSAKSSAHKSKIHNESQQMHHFYNKNAYDFENVKKKKRNLNYSEAQKASFGGHNHSQLLNQDESLTSISNALDQSVQQITEKRNVQLYIKKLRTIDNMPENYQKSPQLRQILAAYNQASGISPNRQYFDRSSKSTLGQHQKIDKMLERYDAAMNMDSELHSFIRSSMEKEYKKKQQSDHKNFSQRFSNGKLPKPHMSEVGQERFRLFKEQIKQNLYSSEDYLFANIKEIKQELPKLEHNQSMQTIQHSINDISSIPSDLQCIDGQNISHFETYQDSPQKSQILENHFKNDYQTSEIEQMKVPLQMQKNELKNLEDKLAQERKMERENYVKTIRMIMKGIIDIYDIILKPPEKRTREQNCQIACFLSYKIDFFKTDEFFDADYMYDVAEKIETKVFQHKHKIFKKGQVNDRIYVSIKGKFGVYSSDSPQDLEKSPDKIIEEFQVIGEKSIQNPGQIKNASVVCIDEDDTICISLTNIEYKKLQNRQHQVASRKRFQFLCRFVPELFGSWTRAKINELNETYITTKLFKNHDVIYEIGQPADFFFIVREGRLEFETLMEIETAFKLPIDESNWEVKRKKKTIRYHIRQINPGDYFGHEEILNGLAVRQTRVKALTSTQLLLVKKQDLQNYFAKDTLRFIKNKHCDLIKLENIMNNMQKYSKLRKQQNQAILDALKINPALHTKGTRVQQQQPDQDVKEYQRIERVKPWLQWADRNATNSTRIIKELNRIKVLSVKHTTYKVPRSTIQSKEDEKSLNDSLKPKAWFISKMSAPIETDGDGVDDKNTNIEQEKLNQDLVFGLEGASVRDLGKLQKESEQQEKIEGTERTTSWMLQKLQDMKVERPMKSTLDMIKNQNGLKVAGANASRNTSSLGPGGRQKIDDSYEYIVSDPERLAEKNLPSLSRRLNAKNFKHQQDLSSAKKGSRHSAASQLALVHPAQSEPIFAQNQSAHSNIRYESQASVRGSNH